MHCVNSFKPQENTQQIVRYSTILGQVVVVQVVQVVVQVVVVVVVQVVQLVVVQLVVVVVQQLTGPGVFFFPLSID